MDIQHKHSAGYGSFFLEEEGKQVAQMTYSAPEANRMVIEHTEVDEEEQGKNIGYSMVHAAVDYARKHNMKITPVCPFVRAVFDKKKEYEDVLG